MAFVRAVRALRVVGKLVGTPDIVAARMDEVMQQVGGGWCASRMGT